MMTKGGTTKEARRFSNWLDVTLENMHLTGHDVAEKCGVNDSAVSRWRNGAAAPSLETITTLADVLHLEPLRLAVTAGQLSSQMAGVLPYPTPVPHVRQQSVREQLGAMRGLTPTERTKLIELYNQMERDGG